MYKTKFSTKLIVIFVLTSLIQGLFIGIFSYRSAKDIVIGSKQRDMRDQINLVDININTQVRYIASLVENMAGSQIVRDLLLEETGPALRRLAGEYFTGLHHALGSSNHILLMDGDRVVFSRHPDNLALWEQPLPPQLAQAYPAAPQGLSVRWLGSTPSLAADHAGDVPSIGGQVVALICPVMDEAGAQALGALYVELDSSTFGNLLLNTRNTFQSQYTFIVDRQGALVCSNKLMDTAWAAAIDRSFQGGSRRFYADWAGAQYYVCGQYNGLTGWRTFSVLSIDNLLYQTGPLRRFIVLCIALSSCAVSAVVVAVSITMTRPIHRLSLAMRTVQKGDFSVRLNTPRRDEMGMLMNAFDFMVQKINTLIREVYEERLAQQNAEMEALEAQINPHFLYNTLDSVNWMLIDRGAYDVSEVIVSLGELLKYAIDRQGGIVTLEQELRYIHGYLLIQKTRLEDRLQFEIDIPPALYPFRVPKLILQPIVENAILHGLAPLRQGGALTITARRAGDHLEIVIADNGQGIGAAELERIRGMLRSGDSTPGSIGIYNVGKRIRIHYGEACALEMDSAPGRGTRVTMRIPEGG